MNSEIRLDEGGTLEYDAPEGRASSATAKIHDPAGTQIAAPSVTIDATNTTLGGTAAAGATSITVASATGIEAGRRYLLDNDDNQPEWVYVKGVSGTTVTLHEPTGYDHTASSTFVGTRLSLSVSAANAGTLYEGCEVRWSYVVDSSTYKPITQYDVVRTLWPEVILVPFEFRRYAGEMASEAMESDIGSGLDFSDEIALATEDVRRDILARGYRPALFRSHDEFKHPIAERVLYRWARRGEALPAVWQDDPTGWIDMRREAYGDALTDALNTTRSYDEDESGAVTEAERVSKLGVIRLRR